MAPKTIVENVNHPGSAQPLNSAKYEAMRRAYLKVVPVKAPGLTIAEIHKQLPALLPQDLFPAGRKQAGGRKPCNSISRQRA